MSCPLPLLLHLLQRLRYQLPLPLLLLLLQQPVRHLLFLPSVLPQIKIEILTRIQHRTSLPVLHRSQRQRHRLSGSVQAERVQPLLPLPLNLWLHQHKLLPLQ